MSFFYLIIFLFFLFSKRKRTCRAGAGTEKTKGKCDTPGFQLLEHPKVEWDHRRCQRLYLPRNHSRVNQTSTTLLESWRGNCDIQVIVYDSDPNHPSLAEVAKVSDYVVAYSCKGNCTYKEEQEQNKQLFLKEEEVLGDKRDIQHVCTKAMNKASSGRLISKQEAVVLLGELNLVTCSETIESVSISNSKRLWMDEGCSHQPFLQQYMKRPADLEHLCLYDYFCHVKNRMSNCGKTVIPHFVGINGSPVFPINDNYAKQSLIVYKPWRIYPESNNWKEEFNFFIHLPSTPVSCKLPYHRVMQRWYDKMAGYEPIASTVDHSSNPVSDDTKILLNLLGLPGIEVEQFDEAILKKLDRGLNFEWDRDPEVR